MSYGNRRVNNQNNNASTRSVSYSGGGGLNERFSKIVKSAAQSNNTISNGNNNNNTPKSSVFSRLRGAKTQTGRGRLNSSIQSRLGKTIGGGIKKKGNDKKVNVVKGISKQSKATGGITKRGAVAKANPKNTLKNKQTQKKKPQKKPTSEDLDKALDAYMMKDPKTAQAKLDAELTSYMDEASELLMEEENM